MAVIRIEVVDARRERASIIKVELPAGSLVRDALRASGLTMEASAVGIFGKRVAQDAPLGEGDRVEIYRPLLLDPKEQRRQRARKKTKSGR